MNSFAANFKTVAKSINESVFGQYNTDYTPIAPNNFGSSTDRLFTIGNGSSNSNRSDAFMVLKNGNVGVGLSIPSEKLEVAGKTKTTNLQVTTGATNGYILQSDANGNATWVNPTALNVVENDPQVSSVTTNKVPKWDGTSLIDGQLFDNGTNIGIGTTNPLAKFEVNGGVRVNEGIVIDANDTNNATNINTLSFGNTSGEAIGSTRALNANNRFGLDFYTNNLRRMLITQNGDVAIGTINPVAKLDVGGDVKVNEGIIVDANGANNGSNLNTLSFGLSSGEAIGSPRTVTSINQYGLDFYTDHEIRMSIAHWGGVAINTELATNNLDVNGNMAIGGDYAGIEDAPDDGLIVQGNVGIGTSFAPLPLTLAGTANQMIGVISDSEDGTSLVLYNSSFGGKEWIVTSSGENNPEGAGNLLFQEASAGTAMIITSDKNVGIGTNEANSRLTVGENYYSNISSIAQFNVTNHEAVMFGETANHKGLMIGYDGNDIQGRSGNDFDTNDDLIINQYGGNVGIGTNTPLEKVHIENGNFLHAGTFGAGDALTVSGSGAKMFFYPKKAAFRAGYANTTGWDDAYIGNYSIVLGNNSMADDDNAIAIGENSFASAPNSVAIGDLAYVYGNHSLSFGNDIGSSAEYAIAIGNSSQAMDDYEVIIGNDNISEGEKAIALGSNLTTFSYKETALGTYNTTYTANNGFAWHTNDRLLVVGNGTSSSNLSNAMVILKNGNTGIGVNTPTNKFEVAGTTKTTNLQITAGATNGYILQSDANGNATWVNGSGLLTETDPQVAVATTHKVPKWNGTALVNGTITDNNGNIGIGTNTPVAKLEISLPPATETLDQSYFDTFLSFPFSTNPLWQSFTADSAGLLTKVSLFFATGSPVTNRTITIYTGEGTAGTILGTGSITSSPNAWADCLLSGITIATGTQYTIFMSDGSYWNGNTGGVYAGGRASGSPLADKYFKTYVLKHEGDIEFVVGGMGVGIGTNAPSIKLDVVGKTKTVNFQLTSGASNGYVLKSDANGNATWVNSNTLTITETDPKVGALNTNYTPRWNGTILTNGQLFDNGTNVGVGTNNPQQKLSISGGINIDQAEQNIATLANGLSFGSNSGEGIASNRAVAFGNPDGLDFYTNHAIRFSITNSGRVGIGTVEPDKAKFEVLGVASNTLSYGYLNGSGNVGTASGTSNYSIYASNRIAASEFNAFSDARIKRVIGVSDKNQDLQTLLKIEIVDYSLIDSIGKGNNNYKKVIAQQVKEVYPQIVSTHVDVIPDIYQVAIIQDGFVALPNTNLKAGEKVKLIFEEGETLILVKAINEKGFFVESPKNGKVFVYGHEVKDFHTVDYEGLSTLNISATQALFRQVIELENNVKNMQHTLNILQSEVQNIQSTHHSILSKN